MRPMFNVYVYMMHWSDSCIISHIRPVYSIQWSRFNDYDTEMVTIQWYSVNLRVHPPAPNYFKRMKKKTNTSWFYDFVLRHHLIQSFYYYYHASPLFIMEINKKVDVLEPTLKILFNVRDLVFHSRLKLLCITFNNSPLNLSYILWNRFVI